jgi:hypothetical protein
MADNSFRANRGRDDIDANSPGSVRDPLAELARLIGQTDTAGDYRTSARGGPVQHYEEDVAPVAPAQEWAAEDRYDDQHQYAEESYAEPQAAEAYPALRDDYPRFSQEEAREPHFDNRYREPAPEHDSRDAPLAYEDQYQDEPPMPRGRQLPALAPEARDVGTYEPEDSYADADGRDQGYQDEDGQWHEGADDQGYATEPYDDETGTAPRRSGLTLVLGVAGLIFIGAASAFAYHSMLGGRSFIPSLPPIIKASESPNKIVPAQAASAGNPGTGDTNTAEKFRAKNNRCRSSRRMRRRALWRRSLSCRKAPRRPLRNRPMRPKASRCCPHLLLPLHLRRRPPQPARPSQRRSIR